MFVFAGLSDAADGWLAKRFPLMTRVGRYLDPAADKVLMLAAFLTLTAMHVDAALADRACDRARRGDRRRHSARALSRSAAARGAALYRQVLDGGAGGLCRAAAVHSCFRSCIGRALWRPRRFLTAVFTIVSWLAYAQLWIKAAMAKGRRVA